MSPRTGTHKQCKILKHAYRKISTKTRIQLYTFITKHTQMDTTIHMNTDKKFKTVA